MCHIVGFRMWSTAEYRGSDKVTDAGVTALSIGCGQLRSINLSYCNKVTDAGVTALSAGCGRLQSIVLAVTR